MERILVPDPSRRSSAKVALAHKYFSAAPAAANDPSELEPLHATLGGVSYHEYKTKLLRKQRESALEAEGSDKKGKEETVIPQLQPDSSSISSSSSSIPRPPPPPPPTVAAPYLAMAPPQQLFSLREGEGSGFVPFMPPPLPPPIPPMQLGQIVGSGAPLFPPPQQMALGMGLPIGLPMGMGMSMGMNPLFQAPPPFPHGLSHMPPPPSHTVVGLVTISINNMIQGLSPYQQHAVASIGGHRHTSVVSNYGRERNHHANDSGRWSDRRNVQSSDSRTHRASQQSNNSHYQPQWDGGNGDGKKDNQGEGGNVSRRDSRRDEWKEIKDKGSSTAPSAHVGEKRQLEQ